MNAIFIYLLQYIGEYQCAFTPGRPTIDQLFIRRATVDREDVGCGIIHADGVRQGDGMSSILFNFAL